MNFMVLARRILGTVLFIVGMVAWILPIIPGWPLIGVGLYILSLDSPGMQTRILQLKQRYPHFKKGMERIERFLQKDIVKKHDDDVLS